jgi:hypothetical protein
MTCEHCLREPQCRSHCQDQSSRGSGSRQSRAGSAHGSHWDLSCAPNLPKDAASLHGSGFPSAPTRRTRSLLRPSVRADGGSGSALAPRHTFALAPRDGSGARLYVPNFRSRACTARFRRPDLPSTPCGGWLPRLGSVRVRHFGRDPIGPWPRSYRARGAGGCGIHAARCNRGPSRSGCAHRRRDIPRPCFSEHLVASDQS